MATPRPARSVPPDPGGLPASALVDYLRERGLTVQAVGGRLVVDSRRRRQALRTEAYRAECLRRAPEVLACLAAEAEARRIEDAISDLSRFALTFSDVRPPEVEWARFPSLVGIYWALAAWGEPPTPDAFAAEVAVALERLGGVPADPEAVRARALRAYPSLVRQQHFEALLRRRFPETYHSEALDHLGIDVLVRDRGLVVGLRLAYDSAAAREWRARKELRHPLPPGLPILDLFARAGELGVGDFWLHHRTQVAEVERFLEATRARLAADETAVSGFGSGLSGLPSPQPSPGGRGSRRPSSPFPLEPAPRVPRGTRDAGD